MQVNCKKPIRIKNTTKYFDPSKDKAFVSFPSSSSFYLRKKKIESFEARLYWQFRWTQYNSCQTFFYTLTYNDKNVPVKYGVNCFDYFDLREFLTGGFRKQLLRKYGLTFKYFIGAELGTGQGSRGFENNPHYHILFFLEPANDPSFSLRFISAEDFRHYVRMYWQGFDEDEDKKNGVFHRYQDAKYGIAKEGDNLGVVTDYRAISYVSKYVTKDIRLKSKEIDILKLLHVRYKCELKEDLNFHKDFFHEVVKPLFFFSPIDDNLAFVRLLPDLASYFSNLNSNPPEWFFAADSSFITEVKLVCNNHGLWNKYYHYLNEKVEERVKLDLNVWRNRYSNKPRISQGVGLFALDNIDDLTNPKITVPSKKGNINRDLPLYLYRKLFTGVVKSNEVTFNGKVYKTDPVRVLNMAGIHYKLNMLDLRIQQCIDKVKARFSLVKDDEYLFNLMINSDVNIDVRWSFEHLQYRLNCFADDFKGDYIFRQYAIYKLVYQDRYYEFQDSHPVLDYKKDFERFLVPSVFSVPRSDLRLEVFLEDDSKNYMSYENHPEFLRFVGFFALFGLITDYFFIQKDNSLEQEAKRREEIRSFHQRDKIKMFND